MAILGVQFVISFIVALFLQKLSTFYSFARWIMCRNLYRYLHPTNDELRILSGKSSLKQKGRKDYQNNKKYSSNTSSASNVETFTIPCGIDIPLQKVEIQEIDLYNQHKYSEYKGIVDYSFAAFAAYLLVELVSIVKPDVLTHEFNLSLVWCSLVVIFCVKELSSLTASYWRGDTSGERSMSIAFGLFFVVVAMIVLIVDESILEFGLQQGYEEFCENLANTLSALGFTARDPPPFWAFKSILVVASAFLGSLLGFPGLRFANMHLDSLVYYKDQPFVQVLFHLSFLSPLILLLMWVKPVGRDLFMIDGVYGPRRSKMGDFACIPKHLFNQTRFLIISFCCLVRMLLTRKSLQSYLNMAHERVAKLKRESGRITNLDLQRKVARVFFYLSSAALQYLCPVLLVFFLALIARSLDPSHLSQSSPSGASIRNSTFIPEATLKAILLMRKVFTVSLFHSLATYFLWWSLLASFCTSVFGVLYLKILT